jgi:hypothetical protein
LEKSSPIILATSEFFTEMLKVSHRPNGENSPNLVTLVKRKQQEAKFLKVLLS